MQLEVGFYGWQPKAFKDKRSPIIIKAKVAEDITLDGLLNYLCQQYPGLQAELIDPDTKRVYDSFVVLLNTTFLDVINGQQVRLKAGDRVKFLLFVAGG